MPGDPIAPRAFLGIPGSIGSKLPRLPSFATDQREHSANYLVLM